MKSYLKLRFSENELKGLMANLNLKDEILEKKPSQLSGGEATRVGILLALLSKPKILICDEITSGLDNETKQKIINLLLSLDKKYQHNFHHARYHKRDEDSAKGANNRIWQASSVW